MKICIVAEGSYPYVTGGVSSWIQTLMTNMPEHEFILYSIGAKEEDRGKFKYTLPANVLSVHEVFLDAYQYEEMEWGRNYPITNEQKIALQSLLNDRETDWSQIFRLLVEKRYKSASNLLTSRDLFTIVQQVCEEQHIQIPFTDFFWTVRSMLLPLLLLLENEIPEADVYHSVSTGYAGAVASFAKWKYNKPFILTEHGIYTREREEEIIKADWISGHFKDLWIQYFYKLSQCAYTYADQVVTLFMKNKEIEQEIGCSADKIMIIPNGISPQEMVNAEIHDRDDAVIHIGAIVRVVPIKDIITMIQSFAVVRREIDTIKFYIMGPTEEDQEYYEECLNIVESLGIEEDVIFTGTVNVKEYLWKMDVMVLSSISEGQPLAILEGMASKKPFVCTDVGSCRELLYGLDDGLGQAGLIVPVMHYYEMGQAIIKLSKDPLLRKNMGEIGHERVSRFYSKDQFLQQYKNLYEAMRGPSWRE